MGSGVRSIKEWSELKPINVTLTNSGKISLLRVESV